MTFALHSRLASDTLPVGELGLCTVRLMNDTRFPWLVLIPRRPDLVELFDLTAGERSQLMEEAAAAARGGAAGTPPPHHTKTHPAAAARALAEVTSALKMNVGAIGNLVAQLHIHVVARHDDDAAWPAPVWGFGKAAPYEAAEATVFIQTLSERLAAH